MTKQFRWSKTKARPPRGVVEAHNPEPPLLAFCFGKEHAPLAPPASRGYIKGGGGDAVDIMRSVDETELSDSERRWLHHHDMPAGTANRTAVLARIQSWDAEVARMLTHYGVSSTRLSKSSTTQESMFDERAERSLTSPSNSPETLARSKRKRRRKPNSSSSAK